jgi:hypothetical protein
MASNASLLKNMDRIVVVAEGTAIIDHKWAFPEGQPNWQ